MLPAVFSPIQKFISLSNSDQVVASVNPSPLTVSSAIRRVSPRLRPRKDVFSGLRGSGSKFGIEFSLLASEFIPCGVGHHAPACACAAKRNNDTRTTAAREYMGRI